MPVIAGVIRKGNFVSKKNILFFTLLGLFIVTSVITLLGVTKVISIDEKYLIALCTAFLVELAAAVYGWSKNGNLLGESNESSAQKLKYIKSNISLQFFGDNRIPHAGSSENIATWFTYFSPSLQVQPKDENGNTVSGGFEVSPNWVVFLVFDKPVSYQQAIANFTNPEVCPIIDIHTSNNRMIALSTRGQMPAGMLNVQIVE
jgi:hypothetical protein